MKKAVLHFSPLELAYQRKYNIMPDYHFDRLYKEVGAEKAGEIVNANMRTVWQEYKAAEKNREQRELEQLARECPFT